MRFMGAPHSSHRQANCSWGQTFPPGDVSGVCSHQANIIQLNLTPPSQFTGGGHHAGENLSAL